MWDNMLFLILGAGLVLAFQELRRQYNAYHQRRWIRRSNEAIALLEEPSLSEQWASGEWARREHQVDMSYEDVKTWGYVEPTDAGPCGCHRTWTEHYEHWDYTCKCHRTKAEHDLEVAVNRAQSTPDTPW
jgi:hypothetical protein